MNFGHFGPDWHLERKRLAIWNDSFPSPTCTQSNRRQPFGSFNCSLLLPAYKLTALSYHVIVHSSRLCLVFAVRRTAKGRGPRQGRPSGFRGSQQRLHKRRRFGRRFNKTRIVSQEQIYCLLTCLLLERIHGYVLELTDGMFQTSWRFGEELIYERLLAATLNLSRTLWFAKRRSKAYLYEWSSRATLW